MTAAKVMDIISRLPGCSGQAADAVSAHIRVKMDDASKLFKITKSECPDIWIRLPKQKWPKSWSSMEDPVVPLERNLYGHFLTRLFWERQRKLHWNTVGKNCLNCECFCPPSKRTILISVCGRCQTGKQDRKRRTDLENSLGRRWPGRTNTISWPWKIWVALKENVKSERILWQNTEICSNPGSLLEPKKNYRPELQGNLMQKQYLLGPLTWKVSQKMYGKYCEIAKNDATIIQSRNTMHGRPSIF